jgi:hypothetical protein
MKRFHFLLTIKSIDDALVNALYGRCADVSVGSSHEVMYVAFGREATNLETAIDSEVTEDANAAYLCRNLCDHSTLAIFAKRAGAWRAAPARSRRRLSGWRQGGEGGIVCVDQNAKLSRPCPLCH